MDGEAEEVQQKFSGFSPPDADSKMYSLNYYSMDQKTEFDADPRGGFDPPRSWITDNSIAWATTTFISMGHVVRFI